MNPGRELDALVAKKVFGHTVIDYNQIGRADKHSKNDDGSLTLVPQYSKHIAAAWMVVEKLNESGFGYCIEKSPVVEGTTAWFVPKQILPEGHVCTEDIVHISHTSNSVPHAICLAALKAVGFEL